ncbi:guanine deaminase [Micromonospora coriariae]|uniref:Guanine deaminase n=1 Tax=Micromonospora coriariae TaxID=285665 RepID=A0A1C4X4N3_9ACTN|nr:amidohydrolase family protein [Micromonospora coriariae]SCF03354.1 guanine deaminase [Micromonospora coriariae]
MVKPAATGLLLAGGLVDLGAGRFERADVRVRDSRIETVGALSPEPGENCLDARRRIIVPGLVNAHTHSNEAWLRARFDNLPLETWLVHAYPVGAVRQTPDEVYLRTALVAAEQLRCGTTSVVDCLYEPGGATVDSLAAVVRAYRDTGIRALICLALADRPPRFDRAAVEPVDLVVLDEFRPAPAAAQVESALALAERFHRPAEGISIGLAPAGIHRCGDELLQRAAATGLDLHVHLAETRPQAADAAATGRSLVRRAVDLEFLGPRVHLSHAVWLSPQDIGWLAASGATVVHNPVSNLKFGSGLAPVPELLRHGVPVALGTDGVCSADGQDLLQAVKLAALLHKGSGDPAGWLGAAEAWHMATEAGARPAGDPEGIGRVASGRRADLTLFDLDHPAFLPFGDPLLHLALGAPTSAVSEVLVGGRLVLAGGTLTGLDERVLRHEARLAAAAVEGRNAPARALAGRLAPAAEAYRQATERQALAIDRSLLGGPGEHIAECDGAEHHE